MAYIGSDDRKKAEAVVKNRVEDSDESTANCKIPHSFLKLCALATLRLIAGYAWREIIPSTGYESV